MHIIENADDPALQAFAAYDRKVVELFAGPGGMSEGAKLAGIPARSILGIEYDRAACETATAAGHPRYLADIAALDPRSFGRAWGLHASPPCPGFADSGNGNGRKDLPMLALALKQLAAGEEPGEVMAEVIATQHDPRSALSLEPMVWLMALRPEWITLEQVPAVLPLWEEYAAALRPLGYHVWAGAVTAETFGVPQARRRAILLASKSVDVTDGLRATHSRYVRAGAGKGQPQAGMPAYVTMAEALGPDWTPTPANDGTTAEDMAWAFSRPSPTIVGSYRPDIVAAPRWRKPGDGPRQKAKGSILITQQQAGILQSFPADYPWQGSEAARFRQAGDAVPPLLGQAMIETVLGRR